MEKTRAGRQDRAGAVEVPAWLTSLWFFGPYGFAAAVVAFSATNTAADLTLIAGLMLEQATLVLWCPPLYSVPGFVSVATALSSLWLCASWLSCGPIRSMLTMEICMNGFLRYIQLLSSPRLRHRSFTHRLAFVTIFHDVDTTAAWGSPQSRHVCQAMRDACRDLVASLGGAFSSGCCLRFILAPAMPLALQSSVWMLAIRTACGVAFIYSSLTIIDTSYRLSLLMARPRAIVCPPAMDAPYLANSFAEFWSRRWDRPMQGILFHGVFLPCKKRLGLSTAVSVFLTFGVSGIIHTFGVAVSGWVSWESCTMMFSFFLLHAGLTLGEAKCFNGVHTAKLEAKGKRQSNSRTSTADTIVGERKGCGWAMTMFVSFLSAPLFVVPFLELVQL